MGYVEWLRVRGCLKWTALALGALLLLAVVFRLALIGHHSYLSYAFGLESDPGAKVTESALPDGAHRINIDDPAKQVRVVIIDRGWNGKHIEIYDYSGHSSSDAKDSVDMGTVHVTELPQKRGTLTVVNTNGETDFMNYVLCGLIVAFIVATVLGAPFAREGDGHLEITLTKPVSRERFSALVLGVDMAGIVAAFVAAIVFAVAVHTLFEIPHITFNGRDALALLVGILAPVAWYAMLTAATASMRRGYGAIVGFAWPVAGIVVALSYVHPDGNPVLAAVHAIAWVLSFIDPLTYTNIHGQILSVDASGQATIGLGYTRQVVALAVLTAVYGALSIVQWKRVEA
ncbi:MAG TPA: hypothetical protein VFE36_00020 [Candidatus Baltobacteraceae bacterium]|jgi:hypothetical protein|nr:hypothetical protein [Candidatus Baltobacteraceae bacterium]